MVESEGESLLWLSQSVVGVGEWYFHLVFFDDSPYLCVCVLR